MKNSLLIFCTLAVSHSAIVSMDQSIQKINTLMRSVSQTLSDTCLFKTVLLECCPPADGSSEEVIEICSQPQKIISNYKATEQEPLEKGWKGYKLVGMEFGGPMQSSKPLTDSDEITPIYELDMDDSIHVDLANENPTFKR